MARTLSLAHLASERHPLWLSLSSESGLKDPGFKDPGYKGSKGSPPGGVGTGPPQASGAGQGGDHFDELLRKLLAEEVASPSRAVDWFMNNCFAKM